jgi:hypothetical protein
MVDISTWATALGALGVGSVGGQYLSGSKDRRSARAAALEALSVMELARWAPRGDDEPPFRDAARQLQSAGLIARIPRRIVNEYLVLAQAGHWESLEAWERNPDPEVGGGIEVSFGELVRAAAQTLAAVIWAPGALRWEVQRRGMKRVSELEKRLTSGTASLARSRDYGV